jgi:hypothetical protein
MRTSSYVVSFLMILCGAGCASSVRQAPSSVPALPEAEPDPVSSTVSQAPLTVAGDIQFTMAERKAKAAPTTEDTSTATTLQPQKASTSGVTSTGVTMQHVHSSQ